jgi:hypothetical protein
MGIQKLILIKIILRFINRHAIVRPVCESGFIFADVFQGCLMP